MTSRANNQVSSYEPRKCLMPQQLIIFHIDVLRAVIPQRRNRTRRQRANDEKKKNS